MAFYCLREQGGVTGGFMYLELQFEKAIQSEKFPVVMSKYANLEVLQD